MSMDKMDTSAVFEMFETINKKLDKRTNAPTEQRTDKPTEPAQIDMTAVNAVTERLENVIEEVRKPVKVANHHTIDIGSSWVFLSLAIMSFVILGLPYLVGEQRRNISLYRNNDLKYRYIKIQGQTGEENLYRLERQFRYGDSIKIIRKQVEKYEELVKEQAERLERARRNSEEMERLQKESEKLKSKQ